MRNKLYKQRGAVSLFVVIFATLLMTIVTVSFIRLMIAEQQRATTVDLSQSAYDSAQAGVEDAKRAILQYETICKKFPIGSAQCDSAAAAITQLSPTSISCNKGIDASPTGQEVVVQENTGGASGDADYLQAYTCVLITLNTTDYIGKLAADSSELIPLNALSAINRVTIEWYSRDDTGGATNGVTFGPVSAGTPLLAKTAWLLTNPSVMRAQLMQVGNSFTLKDFDASNIDGSSDANTLFLYPVDSASSDTASFSSASFGSNDPRVQPESAKAPIQTNCVPERLAVGGYACKMVIDLPSTIGGGSQSAYLRLGAFYNSTHYRVTVQNSGDPSTNVAFNGVQPEVDSTGRATDLFRRVLTRIKLGSNFPYPTAALGVGGNLCKNFVVTDDPAKYAGLNTESKNECPVDTTTP